MRPRVWEGALRSSFFPRLVGALEDRCSRVRNFFNNGLLTGLAEQLIIKKLRNRKDWIPRSNIELVFRVDQRLRALQDREGANRWLHYRWVEIFNQLFEDLEGMIDGRKGFTYLCLGAGTRNGLSLPLLVFMAGAKDVCIVEPDRLDPRESWRAVWGLQEIVLRLFTGSIDSKYVIKGLGELPGFLDPKALFTNQDIHSVLNPTHVTLSECHFEDANVPLESIDLLTSRSTLEHIIEYEKCFDTFARIMSPGGIMYHEIDLTSHSSLDRFVFYYHSAGSKSARKLTGLNELRLSDYLQQFESRGFECTVKRRVMQGDYQLDRQKMDSRFRRYSDDDLLCSNAVIVARKKA